MEGDIQTSVTECLPMRGPGAPARGRPLERPNNSALTRSLPSFAFSRPQEVSILACSKIEPWIAGLDRAFFQSRRDSGSWIGWLNVHGAISAASCNDSLRLMHLPSNLVEVTPISASR